MDKAPPHADRRELVVTTFSTATICVVADQTTRHNPTPWAGSIGSASSKRKLIGGTFGGPFRWFVTQKRLFPLIFLRPLGRQLPWLGEVQLAESVSHRRAITLILNAVGAPSRVCFNLRAGIKVEEVDEVAAETWRIRDTKPKNRHLSAQHACGLMQPAIKRRASAALIRRL